MESFKEHFIMAGFSPNVGKLIHAYEIKESATINVIIRC